ncbi:MAG: zinc ribbon domain-containing protein [Candidatus Bipolaricaulis sp.]|nr:zinc ribbon domain-containing protein [Candidatus Bipolaricaulis sp.]MDD5219312.1 zinc ribbon domain-containing protein [Candidatus Bipolaricaulis sp.]MDD5646902.1 zinc ribbon domain-containing protein [Candidatus Bipolaricaulis sp.]
MPFYRYECESCKNEFRVLLHSLGEEHAACPRCGSRRTSRLLPRIGVIYKGSGYYSTDYRRTKPGGATAKNGDKPASPVTDDHGSGA